MDDFMKNLTKEDLRIYFGYRRSLRETGESLHMDEMKKMYLNYKIQTGIAIPFESFKMLLDYEIMCRYFA